MTAPRPHAETTANRAERDRQAVELAKAGVGYEKIAERIGYANASGAWKAVQRALKATIQPVADEYRELELMRLDSLLLALWPQATKGSLGAADRVLKIMERRAAYLGIDAPTKIEQSGSLTNKIEIIGINEGDI